MKIFNKIFISTILFAFVNHAFALIDANKQQIIPRHFTIAPPFSIESVDAYTNIPNFSVVKTSDNTFDVLFDYVYPTNQSHASVSLWVENGKDKSYALFSNGEKGIQFIECVGCPHVQQIDTNHYEFMFK